MTEHAQPTGNWSVGHATGYDCWRCERRTPVQVAVIEQWGDIGKSNPVLVLCPDCAALTGRQLQEQAAGVESGHKEPSG